jgi:pimeloyl-ACP methyl ester carboxylesterase
MSETKHFHNTIGGIETHWWVYNPDAKKVLIAVHGFRGTHHGLARIAEALPEYRVITPDLPGFGESEAFSDTASLTAYTKWLASFIDVISPKKKIYLLGHSFGTIIASHYIATHHEKVKKLILINPIADTRKPFYDLGFQITQAYYAISRILPETLGIKWLRNKVCIDSMSFALSKSRDITTRAFTYDQHRMYFGRFHDRATVLESYKVSTHHDVREVATHIKAKTLLIIGEKDEVAPKATQLALHQKVTHSTLVTIPKLGHLLPYEAPTEVAATISDFLALDDK